MTVDAPAQPLSGTPWTWTSSWHFCKRAPDEEHWELIEGVAVMMAPPSYAHRRIASNLCTLLNSAFAARRLDLFAYQRVAIRDPGLRNFQPQPDVVVMPGVAGYDLYSETFQLAGDILSSSNTARKSI